MFSAARSGSIGDDRPVGNRSVSAVDGEGDVERRLQGGFVKGRKGAPGIGRLELSRSIVPILAVSEVKASQFVIKNSAEGDLQDRLPSPNRMAQLQGCSLVNRIERDSCALRSV
jgi:hypothetical protein